MRLARVGPAVAEPAQLRPALIRAMYTHPRWVRRGLGAASSPRPKPKRAAAAP